MLLFFLSMLSWAQDPDDSSNIEERDIQQERAMQLAKDKKKSEALYVTAKKLYENAEYQDAIRAFEMLLEIDPDPKLLKEIASAHQFLSQYDEAITYLSQYKEVAPPEELTALETKLSSLRSLKEQNRGLSTQAVELPISTSQRDLPKAPAKWQRGTTVAIAVAGGVTGAFFHHQAFQYRDQINVSCATVDNRLICSKTQTEDLFQREEQSNIIAGVGWGICAAGILTHTFLEIKYGSFLTVSPNSVSVQGVF